VIGVKTADPSSLPFGGGVVTYTITLTNSGEVDFNQASVTDANCASAPVFKSSSDGSSPTGIGSLGHLAVGAWWKFTCTRDLTGSAPGSYTNTAVGFGCQDSSEAGCNNSNHDATATSSVVTVTIATATPAPTEAPTAIPSQPPTDTLGSTGSSGPADAAWLLVVALGVLLASIVILTPARAENR
jgi:Domain of unknown function DUF11